LGDDIRSLGVQGSFDRPGYNWIDIYPAIKGATADENGKLPPVEIPLEGRPQFLDVWVWGSNLNYYLEAYVRDFKGGIHMFPMGSLKYVGWKNLRTQIPQGIPMVTNVFPRSTHVTTFVKFRVWTQPNERTAVERSVSGDKQISIVPFDIYISQLKVFSDIYETIYDGDELATQKETNRLWEAAGNGQ
jgi:hypothetical protein